ncbi:flavodoxin family protein [Pseudoflavonifractor sp. 524-17]|uniref:flavodoxin family protein n=1 Tax=Pseudoflavonifractor sp. 524-17 TaxID=2304577 RepID=UPI00137B3BF1|nr:flavodoxin family protein [Pseudoflavonifractor sp. 524-17]
MARILGISASPRHQATEFAVKLALEAAEQTSGAITTDFVSFKDYKILPCVHCDACMRRDACVLEDDMPVLLEKFLAADGVIFGSPVYSFNPTPESIMFFNRMRVWRNRFPAENMNRKVGAALSVAGTRNGGQEMTTSAIISMFLARGMVVIGGSAGFYTGPKIWTGNRDRQGAQEDEPGCAGAVDIGRRMAHTVLRLRGDCDVQR